MQVPGKLFYVKDGRLHYEDKDQHRKRVELRDKILKSCRSCKCGKQFVSDHGFLEHLKNSKKEGCGAVVIKLQNQIEYGRADTVATKNQDNECNKKSEDDIGRIPVTDVNTPRIDGKIVGRATRKVLPKLPKEKQKTKAKNSSLDSGGFMEDGMKPDEKVAGSKEKEEEVKPVTEKIFKKAKRQRQRSTQPSGKRRRVSSTTDTDLKTSSGSNNVQRKYWCRQLRCETFHPSVEALRNHVTKAHRGVDASQINEHNYGTYGLGIGPQTINLL